jgi:hypothetical protein
MHYAARFDPALVDVILGVVGDEWTRAVLIENRHGEKPVDALSSETEDATAETVRRLPAPVPVQTASHTTAFAI